MTIRKIVMGTAVVGSVLAFALIASAQTASTTTSGSPGTPSQPMVFEAGPAGRVLLRGTIDSVSANLLTVKSWGGDWTVNVGSGAEVLPVAAGNDLTQFKTGDFVGVQGTVSQSANWTVDATLVRDWTYRQAVNQERQQNVQSIRQTIQSGTPRNFQGTAGAVSGSTFTLTVNGTPYTVNVAANAQVVNRNWLTLSLASIQSGDTVRVWGTNASGTITAQIVRDVTIPALPIGGTH
ncbi:MAG: hypothetical protein KGJ89_00845 [Patescibacteria group bacterium]|nr:hypothetical protein [Patescibacteria group bacterium]MDE2015061.1 hypothetical protein [Patescibacteria group bacterium]MDE2226489.1 hypothetical protein [Patescibacteria group bacterium]